MSAEDRRRCICTARQRAEGHRPDCPANGRPNYRAVGQWAGLTEYQIDTLLSGELINDDQSEASN